MDCPVQRDGINLQAGQINQSRLLHLQIPFHEVTYGIETKDTCDLIPFRAAVGVPAKFLCESTGEKVDPLGDLEGGVALPGETAGERVARVAQRIAPIALVEHEVANRYIVRDRRQRRNRRRGIENHLVQAVVPLEGTLALVWLIVLINR